MGMALSGKPQVVIQPHLEQLAGATYALAANRISHVLGLVGPSVAMDTASASSLVAACFAVREARAPQRASSAAAVRAVAAGVNLNLHPNLTHMHTARHLFARDGRCKTFDAAADGFERGEGCGALVMRPLSAASNDLIVATVAGAAIVHKGGGASLRAMRGPAIIHKTQAALRDAGLLPSELKLIEASGLGEP